MPTRSRRVREALLRRLSGVSELAGVVAAADDGDVVVSSAAAEGLLAALSERRVPTVLASLAAATRARSAASLTAVGRGGVLTLHGSPAKGVDGGVAVVVERPRPVELAPLIMRALGLTARERQVTEALLQGASRAQLARRLQMSEHTVGDHLRHLYRKAGVADRGELAALLYGRHYEPPRAAGILPSPYGHFVDDAQGPATLLRHPSASDPGDSVPRAADVDQLAAGSGGRTHHWS